MPRTAVRTPPKMGKHKDLARVRVKREDDPSKYRDLYMGKWGSDEAQANYDRFVAEWLVKHGKPSTIAVTLSRVALLYMDHARVYYRKNGKETSEVSAFQCALRPLLKLYGSLPADDVDALSLENVRDEMIRMGWVRTSINPQIGRIRRVLKWAVKKKLMRAEAWQNCLSLEPLSFGRTDAKESDPVEGVPDDRIQPLKDYLPRQVWGMIQLQLAAAMRPGEATIIRMMDVDTSDPQAWKYVPEIHKNQHHKGNVRHIFLNVNAQAVLKPFITDDPTAYLFSPIEAWEEAKERRQARAKGKFNGTRKPVVRASSRRPGPVYSTASYRKAVARACEDAFGMPKGLSKEDREQWRKENNWSPNQLRHRAATDVNAAQGIDAAQAVLSHTTPNTTQRYIDENDRKAREAAIRMAGRS